MIVAAAFCPQPPVLVPELAAGAAPELAAVRAACADALRLVAGVAPDRLVLIGSGAASVGYSPVAGGDLASYGLPLEVHLGSSSCGGSERLPLSLTVGAWLVAQTLGPDSGAVGYAVGPDFAATRVAAQLLGLAETARVGLVVLGDGSARRSEKAPGYLDDRAGPFDAAVASILRDGDGDALAELDPVLGEQLLAAGVPAWRAAGSLLAGGEYDAELRYDDAPYGVGYFVASWLARD